MTKIKKTLKTFYVYVLTHAHGRSAYQTDSNKLNVFLHRRCLLGYKLYGRVYLNGDGGGRSTHLSVFLVVGRGQFDALLRWPFTQRVTLTLLDQVGLRLYVYYAARPRGTGR